MEVGDFEKTDVIFGVEWMELRLASLEMAALECIFFS